MNEKNQKARNALISAGIEFESEHTFGNGDWSVRFKGDKYFKLYRKGVNILDGVKATYCFSYKNGDYEYKVDGYYHLIRNGEDLLKYVNATDCVALTDGSWWYEDKQGEHEMAKDARIKNTYEQGLLDGRRQLLAEMNETKKIIL